MMLNGDPGELIFQAGFEDVSVPVGEFRFFQNVSGFTATANPVEVQNNSPAVGPSSEGENLLELDGTNGVFVEISEVPTDGLLLQGDYSARRGFDAVQNTIEVLWNGEVVSTLANDGSKLKSTEFSEFEIALTGENSTGRLEFRSTTVNDQFGAGGLLDDIKLFKFANDSQSPTLQAIGDQTLAVGEPYSVQLVATDPDSDQSQLRFSATRAPAGSTLDPISGVFQWTPASSAAGLRFSVEVQVTDETGLTDSKSFRLTVENNLENLPPVLERIEDVTVDERQLVSIQLVASDPDSTQDQLRYSTLRAPAGSSIDPTTGLFTWTPNAYAGGLRFGIDVQVTDETGLSDTKTFRVTVNDVVENIAPVLAEIEDREVNHGDLLSVQFTATDEDSSQDQLRYAALRSPIGSSLDPVSGLFTWTPNAFARGLTFGIDIQVTDETGLTDVQTFRVAVAEADSRAPVLALIEDQTTTVRQTIRVQLVATDNDSQPDQLRYSALRSPIGSVLDPESGLFSWTPNASAAGLRFGIDVRVTDETGLSDTKTFRISVDESDGLAPVLGDIENQTISAGELINVQLTATDADSDLDDLRFTALRSPVGSTLDPVTGLFRWTPNSFAEGLTFGVDVQVTDETGRFDKKTFKIEVQEETGEILLIETQDFETVATRSITIDDAINELEIDFDASFDRQDVDSINDAFEIALLDLDGNSLVHTFDNKRDSFFNHTEGEAPVGGANTVVTGQKVKLDLSHIAVGTTANLVFRLVNNDQDTNTQVRITSIATSDNLLNTPAGAAVSSDPTRDNTPIDFGRLSDVTGSLAIDYGQTSFNQFDGTLFSKIEFKNVGQVAITGRMLAVFDNPTSEQISLLQPDGRLPDGRFFIEVASENGRLLAGQTTVSQSLALRNRTGEQFGFELTILAEVNNAPAEFTSLPPTAIEAGRTLKYTAVAIDPDEGQILRYTIVQGNPAISIGETTGELSWLTTTDDIGANLVTIRATDPYGLYVEQAFTVDVMQSLQNRPPIFITDPVTEATASSGFEITTVGVGNSPAGVSVVNGFNGPRIVTANEGDQTIGIYAGENNDRFDDATAYATGFPTADGQLFDLGYSVDVGLPEFKSPFDVNEVEGMDQGDLNGDGTLDLVVMSSHDAAGGVGLRYQLVISALLGDGDGNFGNPIELYRHSAGTGQYDPRNLVLRDFNNDGALDILATERQQDTRLISILGNGDGSFANATEQRFDGGPLVDFHVADIDEDGIPDLIGRKTTTDIFNFDSAWSRGVGDGTFETPVSLGSARFTFSLNQSRPHDVLDLNDDGHLDFAIMNGLAVQIYHSDGAGNFTLESELSVPSPGADGWLRGGDFNGDGAMDLVYHDGFNSDINLLFGDGSGVDFTLQRGVDAASARVANYAGGDAPTDIDNDGDLDLTFGNSNGDFVSTKVALNDGSGNFTIIEYAMVDFSATDVQRYDTRDIVRGSMFGDYNSDGVMDFSYFTGGADFNGVGIRLGTRPGEFGSTRTTPWTFGTRSQDATPGDFNGDGIIDLLDIANDRISLGLGDGSFAEPFPALGVSASGYVSVADFNLDGIDDIVAPRSNRYVVGLANGDGTFTISDDQLVGASFYGYSSTDIADFNGDGYPDFIAKAGVETHIDVHLNDPSDPGVFSRSFRMTLPSGSQGINVSNWQESYAVADFTGDGILDLSFAERDNTGDGVTKVVVMAGDGTGDFTRVSELDGFDSYSAVVSAPFYEPGDFSAGDIDSDGDVDLISATNYGARIFLNDGTGNFEFLAHLENPGVEQRGRDSWLVDFNEDGDLDLIQLGTGGFGPLSVRLGNGDASFQASQTVGMIGGDPGTLSRRPFADLDGDGHLDFVYGTGGAGNYINYSASIFAGRRDDLVDLISVDLNGDGNEEVLAVQEQMDRLQIFVGDNLGGFTRLPDLQTGRAPQAVAAADLDRDGQLELLTVNRAGGSISVYSGDLINGFTSVEFAAGAGGIDVATADVNGDGNLDVFVLDDVDNAIWIYTGDGTSTLGTPTPLPLGDKPSSFTLADAHGDGLIDVVITLPETNRLMILPGDGNGAFGQPTYVDVDAAPSDVAVVDLNNDGFPELAATLPDLHVLSVAYGLGNSQFSRPQQIQVGQSPERVTLADADEDGRSDLVVTNRGDDTVSVIYNRFDPNEVYRYDSDAVDPDDDTLTYSIVDGPGGLIVNSTTGALLWAASPDQVGVHDVTIAADDGRGGVATQSFKIEVEPARENNSPLIATSPVEQIGAGEAFEYQVKSIDAENDALRYRLLSGPAGASIDPITGLVQWNGNADGAVSINRFATTHGDIRVPVGTDSSLSLNSLTIEGWFNTQNLTSTSRDSLFRMGSSYNLLDVWFFGDDELTLDLFDGNLSVDRFRVPVEMKVNQWRHFALSIDDVASTFELLVDGQSVLSGELPSSFVYDDATRLDIGGGFAAYSGLVDNFRVWSQARSGEQIREGLSRQYDGDPNLVLDYRFEDNDSIVVRDHSGNGNSGFFVENRTTPIVVPGGLAEAGLYSFVIGVEDGRGGFDEQSFTLEIVPELRGAIRGTVFDDFDGDGSQDDGSENQAEPGLAGWHLFIDSNGNGFADPHEHQAVTDATGDYLFDRLLPGDYPVRVSPVAGYATPTEFTATVAPENVTETDPDAAMKDDLAVTQLALSQIQGQLKTEDGQIIGYWNVYADLDQDGQRGVDEPSSMTDRDGVFSLFGLDAGSYTVRAEVPAGWREASNPLVVDLLEDEISTGNDIVLAPTNTSVTGGIRFVSTPTDSVVAREVFQYAAIAIPIISQAIAYDLSLAPEGMAINPSTGLVAWRPNISQVGGHPVILRATAADGSISLHDFTVTVTTPNTPPVIVSSAPVVGYVGKGFAYDLIAQDAEGESIAFVLANGPTNATLDPDSGQLRWTPSAGDIDDVDFTVVARDASGAASIQHFNVSIEADQPGAMPFDITPPRQNVGLGQNYASRVLGVDQLNRPLSWTKTSGPASLTVNENGEISWTAGASDLGPNTIELTATNVDGETEGYSFTINVAGQPVLNAPEIVSEPTLSTIIGASYSYDVEVQDTEDNLFAFTLLEAPLGMSIDASRGTIRWTPAADQSGETNITIEATDPDGLTATQTFKLSVSRFGGPPIITSTPPTEVNIGGTYLYSVVAEDAEGDPLTYRLLTAPAGVSIVETTGEISWTPTTDQLGQQEIVIEVSDGVGGATTQAFAILVGDGIINDAPMIESTAPRFGAVGSDYSYQVVANDPEGTALSFALSRGPDGMTISDSGLLSWTPADGQEGKFVVTIRVTDAGGATSLESFELDILAENRDPVISSTAPTAVTKGVTLQYDVLVNDADLDPITFELLNAPAGASINAFGQITWDTTESSLGTFDFEVGVSDPRGGATTQAFSLNVVADTEGPRVSLFENLGDGDRNILPWQGPFVVFARAIDNVGVASLTLEANGQNIPLSANGTATFEFEDWFFETITATATAVDTSGNVSTETITFDFDVPEGWSTNPGPEVPRAVISSPSDNGTATGFVSIVGTADHEDFGAYILSYRRAEDTSFTEIVRSTDAVVNGELGVWDTTLLRNDEYVLRLQVATTEGTANVAEIKVGLAGDFKLGNFQLELTDMYVEVAGIPIQVTRVYDTLDAGVEGELGFGWQLEFRDADLRVGLPDSGLEDIGIYSALRPGVKVYLNVPGEGRQGFTFNPDIRVLPGFGGNNLVLARPRFTADPGVTSTLSTGTSGYLQVNEQGELFAPGGIPYNPASPDFGGAYTVTTETGITYRIDGATGQLDTATDRNGNTLTFSESGVLSSLGVELTFERDSAGRISSITDPNGNSVQYEYLNGKLVSSTDRRGNITQYIYDPAQNNFLSEVIDPLGRTGLRTEYGPDGRLLGQSADFNNAEVRFEQLLEDGRTLIRLADGSEQFLTYDSRGRVTELVDQAGNTTKRDFDANGLVREIDPLGNETRFVRNSNGDVLQQIGPDGSSIYFTYNIAGQVTSSTNAVGQVTTFEYDDSGNLILINENGLETRQFYDAAGNVVRRELPDGSVQLFTFDPQGFLATQTIGGQEIVFQRDANGNETAQTTSIEVDGVVEVLTLSSDLDANGNLIGITDTSGYETTQQFDAFNNLIAVTSPEGQSAQFDFDGQPQLQGVTFANGTEGSYVYNERNQLVEMIAPSGQSTRFVYDIVGNNIERIYSDDTPGTDADNPRETFEYDVLQRITAQTNLAGERTEFEHDSLGRVVAETNSFGETIQFAYDAVGNLIQQTDPSGNVTQFVYDERQNLIETTFADGSVERLLYDSADRLIEIVDANGSTVQFGYDDAGNLNVVMDATGQVTQYEYDAFGNLIGLIAADGTRTTFEFDDRGQSTGSELADGSTIERTYDGDGRLVSETGLSGAEIKFTNDDKGRIAEIEFADGTTESFSFDERNQLTEIVDINGQTMQEFDSQGLLTRFVSPNGEEVVYEYDNLGRRTAVITGGVRTGYIYDAAGRVVSVLEDGIAIADNEYDSRGNLIATTFGNGVRESRTYDSRSLLTGIEIVDSGGVVLRIASFERDLAGRLVAETEGQSRVEYQYDALGQVVHWTRLESDVVTEEVALEYDSVGNVVRKTTNGVETVFRYDILGQLISKTEQGQTTLYEFDGEGNLVSASRDGFELYRYTFDARGRLTRAEVFDTERETGVTTYEYDFTGLLIRQVHDGVETSYAYDRSQAIPVIISATQGGETEYFFHNGRILGRSTDSGEQFFFHSDASLNVRAQSGEGQTLVFEADFDPFGAVVDEQFTAGFDDPIVDFEFAGEVFDDFSELTYLRQRYLDSDLQRFVSRDPFAGDISLPLSQQPYQYALNSPLNFVDPTGEFISLPELSTAQTIALTVTAVGVTQVIANGLLSNGFVNFEGILGSVDIKAFGAVAGLFGSDQSFVLPSSTKDFSVAAGAGLIFAQFNATVEGSINGYPLPSFSVGSASLEVGRTALTRALRGTSLSGAYIQLDIGYQAGVGESFLAPLIIGFGSGSASGASLGTGIQAGASASFGAYISASFNVEKATATSARNIARVFDVVPTLGGLVSAITRFTRSL